MIPPSVHAPKYVPEKSSIFFFAGWRASDLEADAIVLYLISNHSIAIRCVRCSCDGVQSEELKVKLVWSVYV